MEKEAKFDLNEELKKCKTIADLTGKNGLFKKLLKQMIEGALEGEDGVSFRIYKKQSTRPFKRE